MRTILCKKLIVAGVNIESVHKNLYLAIDVPPTILYKELKAMLDEEIDLGNIDFIESCLSELHR
jgi:hypothetical protein